jgi:hypothetical protein
VLGLQERKKYGSPLVEITEKKKREKGENCSVRQLSNFVVTATGEGR